MKTAIIFLVFFSLAILCKGQVYKENQIVQIIVHKINIPENGSLKEALELTQEWTENIFRKNQNSLCPPECDEP